MRNSDFDHAQGAHHLSKLKNIEEVIQNDEDEY